ncbi:MAG: cobalamin-dependent protein [bacterium]
MRTVHFVFPTMTGKWPISLYGVAPPVALNALHAAAKSIKFGLCDQGRCWDSSIHSHKIIKEVNADDVVCLTATLTGYPSSLQILREAKNKGALTAIGGPWASVRAKEIHERQPWIDYIAVGEGETALEAILLGKAERGIIRSGAQPLRELAGPDLSGWSEEDLRSFAGNYKKMIENGEYGKPPKHIPMFLLYQSARGCIQQPRCAFCGSRLGSRLTHRTGEQFHADVAELQRQVSHINTRIHIFETSDSFTSSLDRFGGNCRGHRNVTFTVFARVDEVNSTSAAALRMLGVTRVSLGIESGSTASLRELGKNTTVEQNDCAVRLLAEEGIQVYLNFMYGLSDETPTSLRRTVDHVLDLCRHGNVYRAKGRVMTPLPLSRWFLEIRNICPEIDDGSDQLDTDRLVKTWLKKRTLVDLEDIEEVHSIFTEGAHSMGVTFSNQTAVWFG